MAHDSFLLKHETTTILLFELFIGVVNVIALIEVGHNMRWIAAALVS